MISYTALKEKDFVKTVNFPVFLMSLMCLMMSILSSCTQKPDVVSDPKKVLTDYISKSFSMKSMDDKKLLLSHLTGETKSRLDAWSEDQFRAAFIDTKRQFVKLLIKEVKKNSDIEVGITYELTYLDLAKGKDVKITNKKLAMLGKEGSQWLIKEVKNINELIEFRNEMALP